MALTLANISASLQWILTKVNSGFKSSKQGPDSLSASINYDTTTTNKIILSQFTLTSGATQTIDLQSAVDLLGASVTMTKAVALEFTSVGNDVKLTCAGTNGLTAWFLRNSGELWVTDGGFVCVGWTYAKAVTVDATHKNIVFTNSSGASAVVTVSVLGG